MDLGEERLEIYRNPSSKRYGEIQRLRRGRRISPQALTDVNLSVGDILS